MAACYWRTADTRRDACSEEIHALLYLLVDAYCGQLMMSQRLIYCSYIFSLRKLWVKFTKESEFDWQIQESMAEILEGQEGHMTTPLSFLLIIIL